MHNDRRLTPEENRRIASDMLQSVLFTLGDAERLDCAAAIERHLDDHADDEEIARLVAATEVILTTVNRVLFDAVPDYREHVRDRPPHCDVCATERPQWALAAAEKLLARLDF